MNSQQQKLPLRPCVGIILLNRAGLVFAGKRIDTVELAWQMPQGGIDKHEKPKKAAKRELLEEIGTCHAEIIAESSDWLTYELPEHLVGRVWKGRYRGQKQKWFVMRFLGQDSDINLNATGHPEFSEWRWMAFAELPEAVVSFKRGVYQQLLNDFGHLAAEKSP